MEKLYLQRNWFIASVLFYARFTSYYFYLLLINGNNLYHCIFSCIIILFKGIKIKQNYFFILSGLIYGYSIIRQFRSITLLALHCVVCYCGAFKQLKTDLNLAPFCISLFLSLLLRGVFCNYNEYHGHFALSNIKGYNLLLEPGYYESKRLNIPIDSANAHLNHLYSKWDGVLMPIRLKKKIRW